MRGRICKDLRKAGHTSKSTSHHSRRHLLDKELTTADVSLLFPSDSQAYFKGSLPQGTHTIEVTNLPGANNSFIGTSCASQAQREHCATKADALTFSIYHFLQTSTRSSIRPPRSTRPSVSPTRRPGARSRTARLPASVSLRPRPQPRLPPPPPRPLHRQGSRV